MGFLTSKEENSVWLFKCITSLGLLSTTANWGVETIEMYFLPFQEVRDSGFQQDLFHQRAVQENLPHVSFLASGDFLEIFSISWLLDTPS